MTIDGVAVIDSPRLDWRTDDAYIGDERDPSVQHLIAAANEEGGIDNISVVLARIEAG